MEMTIDEAIGCLNLWLFKGADGLTDYRLGYLEGYFHKSDKEAYELAIETMRKYQKIEQITRRSEWEYDHEILKAYSSGANETLDKIRAEIQMMADDEWNKQVGASKGLEEALEIIDKYKAGPDPYEVQE